MIETIRSTIITNDDDGEFGVVDKPKRVRCLEDEFAPLNFATRLRGTPRTCTVCGQPTGSECRLCRRPSCAMKRGEV